VYVRYLEAVVVFGDVMDHRSTLEVGRGVVEGEGVVLEAAAVFYVGIRRAHSDGTCSEVRGIRRFCSNKWWGGPINNLGRDHFGVYLYVTSRSMCLLWRYLAAVSNLGHASTHLLFLI
jgi:hypothetical protein